MSFAPILALSILLLASVSAVGAQHDAPSTVEAQHGQPAAGSHGTGEDAAGNVDIITPHITDSHHLEVPYWKPPFYREIPTWPEGWGELHIGTLDVTPTKHVWMLLIAATLCAVTLVTAARAHKRHSHKTGVPKGFAAGIEATVLYMRNEVVLPNVGHHGEKFVPFILTLFFFILFANLLGLIPYGSTATGNISVTATLAIITFLVIEFAGMRALGAGYLKTIVYWPHDQPLMMKLPMTLIMTPIEIIGKFTKPFALAIRLFANMTAGHIVVLALIGLISTFASVFSAAPFLMAVAIMMLELFVALLQSFIFALLASVFIGQIREGAH